MAVLKAIVENLDDVPEVVREFYKQQGEDGPFVLGIDGIDDHPAVKGLKTNQTKSQKSNATLKERVAELEGQVEAFGGVTPDEVDELRQRADAGGKAPTKEEIDELVAKRWSVAEQKLTKQVEALTKQRDEAQTAADTTSKALAGERISAKVRDAAAKAGIRPKAMPIVTRMAGDVWRLGEDGAPAAFDGEEPMNGAHGPLQFDEWVETLRADHDYLFEASTGAGAAGNAGERRPGGVVTIPAGDKDAAGMNLEALAKGKAQIAGW